MTSAEICPREHWLSGWVSREELREASSSDVSFVPQQTSHGLQEGKGSEAAGLGQRLPWLPGDMVSGMQGRETLVKHGG